MNTGTTPPLTDVHGDTPIYVYHGKGVAETDFLADYAAAAPAIARNADGASLGDRGFWSPYWHFTRLGHVLLAGSVVALAGVDADAIVALQWVYAGLISLAVLLAAMNALALAALLGVSLPREAVLLGSVVSAALFVLSDIFGYLGRSIVSETPALTILAAATLLFVNGQQKRSLALSAAGGLLSFLLYFVRAEAIWSFLVFLVALAGAQRLLRLPNLWYRGYAAALSAALASWVAYLVWMFPLPDPRLFIAFSKLSDIDPYEVSVYRLSGSIGLLLVGLALSIATKGQRRIWVVPLVWAALALLPSLPYLVSGRSVQTRMFVPFLVMPAFVASAFGWATLFSREPNGVRLVRGVVAGVATCLFVMISVPAVYDFIHSLPGLWRIQVAREWLGPLVRLPRYEKKSYEPRELNEAARVILKHGRGAPVVADDDVQYGNLYLLRYFMEPYPASARLVTSGEPVSATHCPLTPAAFEPRSYCVRLALRDLVELTGKLEGSYWVGSSSGQDPPTRLGQDRATTLLFSGGSLRVWHVGPRKSHGAPSPPT